jgi:hypothetical protein
MAQAYLAAEALVLSIFVCHCATLLPHDDTQAEGSPDKSDDKPSGRDRSRKWSSALHERGRSLAKLMTCMLVPLLIILLMVMVTDAVSRSLSNFVWSGLIDRM